MPYRYDKKKGSAKKTHIAPACYFKNNTPAFLGNIRMIITLNIKNGSNRKDVDRDTARELLDTIRG